MAPVKTRVVELGTDEAIESAARESDALVVSGVQRGLMDRLFGHLNPAAVENEHGTLVVYRERNPGRIRTVVERHLF